MTDFNAVISKYRRDPETLLSAYDRFLLERLPVGQAKGEYIKEEPVESSAAFRARMERDCARPIATPRLWPGASVFGGTITGCTSGPALVRPRAMRAEDV